MTTAATQGSSTSSNGEVLHLAFELGSKTWKLGFTTGLGQKASQRNVRAGAVEVVRAEIARAKRRFGLSDEARVVSCYEAGPQGFWLHRFLLAHGVENVVVDSASIEVNRREVGAVLGMTPTPYQSGESCHEQGISKAGNVWTRRVAIQIAWGWVHWQPESALSRWFATRFASGGRRQRRVGIVALARKLMIALWRYAHGGALPAGAIFGPLDTYVLRAA